MGYRRPRTVGGLECSSSPVGPPIGLCTGRHPRPVRQRPPSRPAATRPPPRCARREPSRSLSWECPAASRVAPVLAALRSSLGLRPSLDPASRPGAHGRSAVAGGRKARQGRYRRRRPRRCHRSSACWGGHAPSSPKPPSEVLQRRSLLARSGVQLQRLRAPGPHRRRCLDPPLMAVRRPVTRWDGSTAWVDTSTGELFTSTAAAAELWNVDAELLGLLEEPGSRP